MKKFSLLFISALVAFSISAQEVQNVSHGTVFLRNRAADNWFINLGGGTNLYFNQGENDANTDFMDRLGWQGQIAVGRWNSPNWGARVVLEGGHINTFAPGTHGDHQWLGAQINLMYNLMNAWGTYRPDRIYSLIPFGGVGYMYGLNDWERPNPNNGLFEGQNQALTFNVGLINQFMFSPGFGVFVELAARIMPDTFDGTGIVGNRSWDAMFTASAGVTIGLGGKQTFTPAELMDYSLINDLNSQINRLRAENEELRRRPVSCPDCPPVPAPVVGEGVVHVPNVVFFRINSAVIDRHQLISVHNTAEFLRANPNARVRIAAYADRGTGTPAFNMALSERRARAVAAALEGHGIASNRIDIEWHGDTVQPFAENDWNRVAIFFIQ